MQIPEPQHQTSTKYIINSQEEIHHRSQSHRSNISQNLKKRRMNFFLHLPHGCPSRRRTAVPTPSIYRRSTATWAPIPWPLLPVDLAEGEGASATTSVARPPPLLLPPGCRFRFSRELERHRERREWIRMCETCDLYLLGAVRRVIFYSLRA
ncbi:hypothetical protein [Oryza sativa Japonica Group]|uniref:Uncharacterized protein n=1 Tax=Oryza sativa subsp. japonica TaxID=39947 RepID=Q5VP01_ORYSJ|nr:hypothetical protein [Oryza sativa Japonica Group]